MPAVMLMMEGAPGGYRYRWKGHLRAHFMAEMPTGPAWWSQHSALRMLRKKSCDRIMECPDPELEGTHRDH